MKASLAVLAIAVVMIAFQSTGLADPPTQTALNFTFAMPKCDDRDHDTGIQMWVDGPGGEYARNDNIAPDQQFRDPGTYGPFSIAIENAINKNDYQKTKTHLHISPKVHDTWCTVVNLEAIFTDNSKINTSSGVVVKVSEANRDAVFGNQGQ